MTVGVLTCSPDTPAGEIARVLTEKNLEAVVVVKPEGKHAVGMVSQVELLKAYSRQQSPETMAEEIMRDDIPQIPAEIPIETAAQIMLDQGVRVLYIMHRASGEAYPAALISYSQLLRHIGAKGVEDLKDLGIQAARQSPLETFITRRDAARKKYGGGEP